MAYQFNIESLYEKTDNGLEILKHFLGNCKGFDKALQNDKNLFYYRNESTASASLIPNSKVIKSNQVNYWRIKDFGGNFHTPISIAMEDTGLEFYPCLKYLYELFQLSGSKNEFFKAATEAKTLEEKDERPLNWFNIVKKEKCDKLDIIGKFVTEEIANKYHFYSVDYYEKVFFSKKTNLKTYIKVTATDSFPIFCYMPDDNWCKLYAPFSQDKQYKHGYLGTKPERYVHGFQQIKDTYNTEIAKFDKDIAKAKLDKSDIQASILESEKSNFKLPAAIIASGGSDGMNVAALDYNVIWFNSESEQISYSEYTELKKMVQTIYNLPDVDESGIKYGYSVAENFWNMKSIWLPKDKLGSKGKDFRDWLKYYNQADLKAVKFQFNNLIIGALRMKFFDRNAKNKTLKINTAYLHYFLKVKGFYIYYPEKTFTDKVSDQEYLFIKIENNIVVQAFANTMKKFCEQYMINKGQPIEVINLIKNTTQFTDKNLLGLDSIILDFNNFDADTQKFYFKNQFATITADKIEMQGYKDLKSHVWSDKIINHTIFNEKNYFNYSDNKLELLRTDCEYMNFLINTSRIFWKKELEEQFESKPELAKAYHDENRFRLTSDYLTEAENEIQTQHFLSKIFAIGYMLHRYKIKSFARLLYIMDDMEKDSDDDRNGGSGKSMILEGINCLLANRLYIDGSSQNLFSNPFILAGLTKETDYIWIDDLAAHYSIDPLYVWITGSLMARPLYKAAHEVSFFDAGKIATTRNFGLKNATGSDLRRVLFLSTSDYYHMKSDSYNEERRVSHDFGHDLFLWDKDSKQPSIHFGFLMQCLQFYLQHRNNEILAPQKNIDLNNQKAGMGDAFIEWADSYFTIGTTEETGPGIYDTFTGTINEYIPRSEMQEAYKVNAGKFAKTPANFKKSLIQYCKMKGWNFNPKDLQGSDGTIKKPITDGKGKRQIVEHFYISNKTEITPIEKPIVAIENDIDEPDLAF